jgi:hypothetical protein
MKMKLILSILMMLLTGCAGLMISSLSKDHILSPDEINAYNRVGYGVDGCITASGPPPAGATTWIIHRDLDVRVEFTDGCHIK